METSTPLPAPIGAASVVPAAGPSKVQAAIETVKGLGAGRLLALGTVLLGFLVFFVFVGTQAMAPSYALLFADLKPEDARLIADRLQARGTPFRLNPAGDAIMAPQGEIGQLRMDLAADGMPAGSVVGYEIFDQSGSFGQTDFLSNVNLRRAMEGELSRSISTLKPVRGARVHIVQPERSLFRRDEAHPTASVVLSLRSGNGLDGRQVQAIRNLVAAAVPGLEPTAIAIVDDRGNLLARMGEGDGSAVPTEVDELRSNYEQRVKQKIVQLLERSIGPGMIDAEVTVEMNFDQVTTTAETFDPQSQVARSTQTVEEDNNREEAAADRNVSVSNNLPTAQPSASQANTNRDRSNRSEETVNFEISRTVRNEIQRPGGIKRLSIAVQVDGIHALQPDGSSTYTERSSEELKELAALAKSAAGFDEARGDIFQIASRRFVEPDRPVDAEPSLVEQLGIDSGRLIDLGIFALLTLAVIFFGVRPLLHRLAPPAIRGETTGPVERPRPAAMLTAPSVPRATEEGDVPMLEPDTTRRTTAATAIGQLITSDEAGLLQEITQIVDHRPQDAVKVIRTWLGE